MIRSMTAFARGNVRSRQGRWVIEIRSLNHRFFECSLKLSPEFYPFEARIRDLVHSKIARGKVAMMITQNFDGNQGGGFTLDDAIAKSYWSAIQRLKRRFNLQGEVTTRDFIYLPQIFTVKKTKESVEKRWPGLQRAIHRVLVKAVRAKQLEGRKIARDIRYRLRVITQTARRIERHVSSRKRYYFEKLKERLSELVRDLKVDEERIWREVVFLVDKTDITEELVRLQSHLKLFSQRLSVRGEVGRELDFFCQEMHREVNTMSAKAQFFEISREVVLAKGELEKIREQIQNIE